MAKTDDKSNGFHPSVALAEAAEAGRANNGTSSTHARPPSSFAARPPSSFAARSPLSFAAASGSKVAAAPQEDDETFIADEDIHEGGHSSWVVASMHLMTAIIGAGVLALPHALSWLGWAFGVPAIVLFYGITMLMNFFLADVHEANGKRHARYLDAVRATMGPKHAAATAAIQMFTLALASVGLMIAGSGAMRTTAAYACAMAGRGGAGKGGGGAACLDTPWAGPLIFAAVQIPLSLLPNIESIWAVSVIGAVCSIGYSVIGLALGASSAKGFGSLWGRSAPPLVKAMRVFEALGDVCVSYFSAIVILEIQDTLRHDAPGKATRDMKKAITTSLTIALGLFVSVASSNYSALGDLVPDSVLEADFPHVPSWVPLIANIMIVLHMVSAFQVYAQPLFHNTELFVLRLSARCRPNAGRRGARAGSVVSAASMASRVLSTAALAPRSNAGRFALRAAIRWTLLAIATVIALCLPSFSAVLGLLGALLFWPLGCYYPMAMFAKVHKGGLSKPALWAMHAFNVVLALFSIGATIGSVWAIAQSARGF